MEILTQRVNENIKIQKYLKLNQEAEAKEVKSWIKNLTSDPMPEANLRGLNKTIGRYRKRKI